MDPRGPAYIGAGSLGLHESESLTRWSPNLLYNIVSLLHKESLFPSTIFDLLDDAIMPMLSLLRGLHLMSWPGSSICRVMPLGHSPNIIPQDCRDALASRRCSLYKC